MTQVVLAKSAAASPDLLNRARSLLSQAQTLGEVLNVRNISLAAQHYFKAAEHSRQMAQDAAELRLRAERKAGQMLEQMAERGERASGHGGDRKSSCTLQLDQLADLGIEKTQSHRWQQIASVPEPVFEKYIEEGRKSELNELTSSNLFTIAKFYRKAEQAEEIRKAPTPMPDGPFAVIVADPPWPYSQRRPTYDSRGYPAYSSMTIEEITAMPIAERAADNSVLWLWTTNAFIREGFECLKAWGFEYRTILTWAKNRIGLGDWLRGQTEHCLLASKGHPLLTLTNQSTLLYADVQEHSVKPAEFYALVESLCPTPQLGKLELFARTTRPGWRSWGAEVEYDETAV